MDKISSPKGHYARLHQRFLSSGIDGFLDKYIDGYDNDGNGKIDDSNERASTES